MIRSYRATVEGFDFRHVYARALNRGRARYMIAAAYEDAGMGSLGDGLAVIKSCVLDPSADGRRVVGQHGRIPGEGTLEARDDD